MADLKSVITGDIVASSKLPVKYREKLYTDIRSFLALLKSEGRITAYEMFRGDSIQCVVSKKEEVLRTAIMTRAWLKSYTNIPEEESGADQQSPRKEDIRLSIGIGEVDFLKDNNLSHSDGEAFHLSGLGLDNLKNSQGKMSVQTSNHDFNEIMEAMTLLLDAVLEKWTSNQAEIILFKLRNIKEEQIAREIGISQSAVNQRTKTSQWTAIEKSISWFEKTIKAW